MDPMKVLLPNNVGNLSANSGVESLTANTGLGAAEIANSAAMMGRHVQAQPNAGVEQLRIRSAKQFGMKKEQVGF